jgi:hypothetical protein
MHAKGPYSAFSFVAIGLLGSSFGCLVGDYDPEAPELPEVHAIDEEADPSDPGDFVPLSSGGWCLAGSVCTSLAAHGVDVRTYSDLSSGLRTGIAIKNAESHPVIVSIGTTCEVGSSFTHTISLDSGRSISRHLDELGLGFCWRGTTRVRTYHPLNGSKKTAYYFSSLTSDGGASYTVCSLEGCWDQ